MSALSLPPASAPAYGRRHRRAQVALGPEGLPVKRRALAASELMVLDQGNQPVKRRALARGEFKKALALNKQQRRDLRAARRTSGLGEDYLEPNVQLPASLLNQPFKDAQGRVVASYAAPKESVVKTAYKQGQMQLPAFYQHPQLGPWGVDPQQAYQYWIAQQQAMQAAAAMFTPNPMAIYGSQYTANTPGPLPASPLAQPAAFDPYSQGYPSAGAAVERF